MKFIPTEVIHALPNIWKPVFIKGTLITLWDSEKLTLTLSDGVWRSAKSGQRMPHYIQEEIQEYLDTIRSTPSSADSTPSHKMQN